MRASKSDSDAIKNYVESQAHEEVVHLEKAAGELSGRFGTTSGMSTARGVAGG